jgi:acyl-CoA thioesterase FadM
MEVVIQPSWVVTNENRLSYTTMTRLVECCREYHWHLDIAPIIEGDHLDSICKSLKADFLSPINVWDTIIIRYSVLNVRRKGYELHFEISDKETGTLRSAFSLVSVFFDPQSNQAVAPPEAVALRLELLLDTTKSR